MGQIFVKASYRAKAHYRKGTSSRRLWLSEGKMNQRQFNRDYRPRTPRVPNVHRQIRSSNLKRLKRTSMSVKARRSFAASIRFAKDTWAGGV